MNKKWSTFMLTGKHRGLILTMFAIHCKRRRLWRHRTVQIGTKIIKHFSCCTSSTFYWLGSTGNGSNYNKNILRFIVVELVCWFHWLDSIRNGSKSTIKKIKQKRNKKWWTFISTDKLTYRKGFNCNMFSSFL
jgi:hypothetical protein